MGLFGRKGLEMAKLRRRRRKPLNGSAHRLRGCPLTRNLSGWCHGYCAPHEGRGICGRVAPHAVIGRTQAAIIKQQTGAIVPQGLARIPVGEGAHST